MTHADLTTYRVCRRCTVRAQPKPGGEVLSRMEPTKDDGTPRLITGRPAEHAGWVEWVEGGERMGYIRAGLLRELSQ